MEKKKRNYKRRCLIGAGLLLLMVAVCVNVFGEVLSRPSKVMQKSFAASKQSSGLRRIENRMKVYSTKYWLRSLSGSVMTGGDRLSGTKWNTSERTVRVIPHLVSRLLGLKFLRTGRRSFRGWGTSRAEMPKAHTRPGTVPVTSLSSEGVDGRPWRPTFPGSLQSTIRHAPVMEVPAT